MISALMLVAVAQSAPLEEPVVVACKFEKLPLILLTFRDPSRAPNNAFQVGDGDPQILHMGSSLMTGEFHGQEFTFSLRLPASVTVSSQGADSITYDGECVSSLKGR